MAAFVDGELTGPWAARVPVGALAPAGRLRGRLDVRVCGAGDDVWLRGDVIDTEVDLVLRGRLTVLREFGLGRHLLLDEQREEVRRHE